MPENIISRSLMLREAALLSYSKDIKYIDDLLSSSDFYTISIITRFQHSKASSRSSIEFPTAIQNHQGHSPNCVSAYLFSLASYPLTLCSNMNSKLLIAIMSFTITAFAADCTDSTGSPNGECVIRYADGCDNNEAFFLQTYVRW